MADDNEKSKSLVMRAPGDSPEEDFETFCAECAGDGCISCFESNLTNQAFKKMVLKGLCTILNSLNS